MTREAFKKLLVYARQFGGTGLDDPFVTILDHDAAQRQEIERLRAELDHWTYELFKHRESMLRKALQGILDIGERDMTSPKYDGYFEAARQALKEDS